MTIVEYPVIIYPFAMEIIKGSRQFKQCNVQNPVITLGNFDGVHKGHQKILHEAIKRAGKVQGSSVVYTFDPHPLQLLKPEFAPLKITTREEQARRIESQGIDYLVYEHFTRQFAERTPEEFIKKIIVDRLRPKEIIIGHDYAFGKGRRGSVALLEKAGKEHDFKVQVIKDIRIKNIRVRSTTLRNLIDAGKVSLAAKLMGRPYSLTGRVVHGKQRRIGFPTANLTPSHRDLTPGNGVYAIRVTTPYGEYDAIVNIGFNPTFEGNKRVIEAHIFNFSQDLYSKDITLHFIKRIRGEKKFKDVETLTDRIAKDIAFAKKILSKGQDQR